MGFFFRRPNINGKTDSERIAQTRSFLFQLTEQLQFAFDDISKAINETRMNNSVSEENHQNGRSVIESGDVIKDGVSWYYRKWYDGTAECWAKRSVDVDATTEWGSLWRGTVSRLTFPFVFKKEPICNITAEQGTTAHHFILGVNAENGKASMISAPSVNIFRNAKTSGMNVNILYNVHGRWK